MVAAVRLENLRAARYISFIARCIATIATNLRRNMQGDSHFKSCNISKLGVKTCNFVMAETENPRTVQTKNTHLLRWMCMRTAAWMTTAADRFWASSLRSWWPLTCLHQCKRFVTCWNGIFSDSSWSPNSRSRSACPNVNNLLAISLL